MKKIITVTLGICLTLGAFLYAAEEQPSVKNQYGYVNLGVGPAPLPIPQFGCGYRFQNNSNGFDVNAMVSTVVYATTVKIGADYIYYFNPNLKKQFYMGAGPALIGLFGNDQFNPAAAPELIFGKEYLTDTGARRNFQASVIWPTYYMGHRHSYHHHSNYHNDLFWYPLLSLSYGWGF